jgi:putative transposase
VVNF